MKKSLVVVGGSSGIGLALIQLVGNDYDIINISRTHCPVSAVESRIADVKDGERLKAAFSDISRIDALVYCAGSSLAAPTELLSRTDLHDTIDINLTCAVECCTLALPRLDASGDGRIILFGSLGGVVPIPFDAPYSAAKAGLRMFAREFAVENPRVKCTCVNIGGTRTCFSFKRKIYENGGKYRRNLKAASDSLIKLEQTGYTASYVAARVAKLLAAKDPPPEVCIGLKTKLAATFYRLMPSCLGKIAVEQMFGITHDEYFSQ